MPRKNISHPDPNDDQKRQDETDIASSMSKENFLKFVSSLMKPKQKKMSAEENKKPRGDEQKNSG